MKSTTTTILIATGALLFGGIATAAYMNSRSSQPAAPPVFVPSFYQELPEPQRAKGGLSALAQKARTLMGTPSDDEHQPTIRDLQTTVDFKTAFHAPVLPKRAEHHEEE